MKVLIAMDSFKGNLSSLEVAGVVEQGIRRVYPDALIQKTAIADGGEGTAETLVDFLHGQRLTVPVKGPLGKTVQARYGIINGDTAVMEMAEASGIALLRQDELDPLRASTFGTGQMILDALGHGCRKIILGIGGSATNDGGQGMAAALGIRFYGADHCEVGLGGGELAKITDIDLSGIDGRVRETEFLVACDVDNPLCGVRGASYVFGPQKGADDKTVALLDAGMESYGRLVEKKTGISVLSTPGSGAAGGLGAALKAFCSAALSPGIEIVMKTVGLEEKVAAADIIVTGEGRVDFQTAHGKVPAGVAQLAKKHGKPVFAIAGYAGINANEVYSCGIDAVISSITAPIDNEEAIRNSVPMIEDAAERLFRVIRAVRPAHPSV